MAEQTQNQSAAEIAKKKGNDAYLAKNYTEAIEFYSEAIKEEPENAIYYSNRSACYASLKQWQKAYEDAIVCVTKDPKFIKGYYRLSSAQTELKMFDDSLNTLKAALTIEPDNEVLLRQMKSLQAKKAAASAAPVKSRKQLTEAQLKEAMEIQDQTSAYTRDVRIVNMKLAGIKRDSQINKVTYTQMESLKDETRMYRSVGKAFVFSSRKEIEKKLDEEVDHLNKDFKDLSDRKEYLERRILANTENLKDLTGIAAAS